MVMKDNFISYITTRKIGHYLIPPPLQIMLIRKYCQSNNILFSLPVEELIFENCFIELQGIIINNSKIDGIIMPSIFLLPNNSKKRKYYFEKFKERKIQLHFILESIIIDWKKNSISEVETIILLNNLIDRTQKETISSVKYILNQDG